MFRRIDYVDVVGCSSARVYILQSRDDCRAAVLHARERDGN